MEKNIILLPKIKLMGLTVRTNNRLEANPTTAQIMSTAQKYFQSFPLLEKVSNGDRSNEIYCVYTDYESDFTGDYTYFIGEERTAFTEIPEGWTTLTIPPQTYSKLTFGPDKMPEVCINGWQQIWAMTPAELGGERAYIADFEIYDKHPQNPKNILLDIYIGLQNKI